MNNKLTIGLFGFGVVGKGLYEVLHRTPTLQSGIKKICIKNINKQRSLSQDHFTDSPDELLNDESINVIVELIDDAEAAFGIVKKAMLKKKAVVSANKKMIAAHFEELLQLQQRCGVPFLYEASCCASIPVIRNLEEYYDNDLLQSFRGIVNGSTNFILTKMFSEGLEFSNALLLAQQAGFAESNPVLDTEGYDAANKLSILLAHSFGVVSNTSGFIFTGIQNLSLGDALLAKGRGWQVKLVANARKLKDGKLAAFVLPQFVASTDDLYTVSNEFNGVVTESSFADRQFFKGRGAGAFPTASAVLSDISALRYDYRYEYKKIHNQPGALLTTDYYLQVFVSADDIAKIRRSDFESVEESHHENRHSWLIGAIHAEKLIQSDWWKQPGVSLVACIDPVNEDVTYKRISRRSLQLAGVNEAVSS